MPKRALAFAYGMVALVAAVVGALLVGVFAILPFVVLPRGKRERFTIVGASAWGRYMSRLVLLANVEFHGAQGLAPAEGGARDRKSPVLDGPFDSSRRFSSHGCVEGGDFLPAIRGAVRMASRGRIL